MLISCSNRMDKALDYNDILEEAFKIESTTPYYLVVNIIDLNTLNRKEICCENIVLSYALNLDSVEMNIDNLSYDSKGIPIFEFKSEKALEQLEYYQYNEEIVDSLIKNSQSDLIENILIENNESGFSESLELNTNKFTENYFEHFLFRKGIFTYRDCESGYTIIINEKS